MSLRIMTGTRNPNGEFNRGRHIPTFGEVTVEEIRIVDGVLSTVMIQGYKNGKLIYERTRPCSVSFYATEAITFNIDINTVHNVYFADYYSADISDQEYNEDGTEVEQQVDINDTITKPSTKVIYEISVAIGNKDSMSALARSVIDKYKFQDSDFGYVTYTPHISIAQAIERDIIDKNVSNTVSRNTYTEVGGKCPRCGSETAGFIGTPCIKCGFSSDSIVPCDLCSLQVAIKPCRDSVENCPWR